MNHNTRSLPAYLHSLVPPNATKVHVKEGGGFSEFESISIDFGENGGAAKENEARNERKSDAPSPSLSLYLAPFLRIERVRCMMNYVDFFSE